MIADSKLSMDGGWDNRSLVAMIEEIHGSDAEPFGSPAFSREEMDDLMKLTMTFTARPRASARPPATRPETRI